MPILGEKRTPLKLMKKVYESDANNTDGQDGAKRSSSDGGGNNQ